jgi:predicted DNA-binding protein (UPF0251 family)
MTEKFITRDQLATELGISRITLWRRLREANFDLPRGLISPEKKRQIVALIIKLSENNHSKKSR